MFNGMVLDEIERIKKKYPDQRSAMLPSLYLAQREFGWLSDEAVKAVSHALNVPPAMVRGTASFYSMFRNRPVGRHLVQLCTNISCMILGAESVLDFFRNSYGLVPGGMTGDGRFSLVVMECIGACGTAPAMLINTDFYENLTEQSIGTILDRYR